MTYGYRQTPAGIDLFVSETNRRPPRGYVRCSRAMFRTKWQEHTAQRFARLLARTRPLELPE